jgi:hypothetical protein
MRWRIILTAASVSCSLAGSAQGQQRLTVVGCVAPADAAAAQRALFLLTSVTPPEAAPRNRGSNSPKSSTPIGGQAVATASGSSGSNTPKASTPLLANSNDNESFASSGVFSAKASVPVRRKDALSRAYELHASPNQFSFLPGQTVEITGAVRNDRSGESAPALEVQQVRMLASDCAVR